MGIKMKEKEKRKNGVFAKIIRSFKLIKASIDIVPLLVYIAFYTYKIISQKFIVLYTILLSATIAYAVFCIVVHSRNSKKLKSNKKVSKFAYAIVKALLDIAVRTANIVAIFYAHIPELELIVTKGIGAITPPMTILLIIFALTLIYDFIKLIKLIAKLLGKLFGLIFTLKVRKAKKKAAAALTETKEMVVTTAKETAEKVKDAAENTKNALDAGVDKTKTAVVTVATNTKNAITGTAKKAGNAVVGTAKKAGNAIATTAGKTKTAVVGTAKKAGNAIAATAGKTKTAVANAAKNTAENAKKVAGGAKSVAGKAVGGVKSLLARKKKSEALPEGDEQNANLLPAGNLPATESPAVAEPPNGDEE